MAGAFATLFAWFGLRTWTRQQSTLEVSDQAVALAGPRPQRVPLADLCEVRLAYFAPRRTREHGWFELSLKATGGQRLRVDSNLERFDALLARVIAAARAQRLPLDPTTLANLAELGLVGEAGAGEG